MSKRILKNKKDSRSGFTLVETLVVVVLLFLAVTIGSNILIGINKASLTSQYSSNNKLNIQSLNWALPIYLGQAINIDWTSSTINNINSNRGRIRKYTSSLIANPLSPPDTVAVFLREAGHVTNTLSSSDIRGTAIYFKNPTVNSPGVLTISSTNQGTGSATLSSENYAHRFSHIVELEVQPVGSQTDDNQPVRTTQFRIVFRKFLDMQQQDWQWCPQDQISSVANCQREARFVDTEHFLNIPIVNNRIESNFTTETGGNKTESIYGSIYFFTPSIKRE